MYGCIALLAACAAPASALSAVTNKRARGHGLLQRQLQATARADGLVAPQGNDTIPDDYWNMVDERIAEHETQTQAPVGANDQATTTVSSSWSAKKMFGFEQPGTSTPAPSQDDTSAQFVAQCPMIMFNTDIYIEAPKCDSPWGAWKDPGDDFRPIVRWKTREDGGLLFGVDSVVNGEGAAEYAKLKQDLSLSSPSFQLANCMGVRRYSVDEEVVKVLSVSQGVSSTGTGHDTQDSGEAFFYRYTIKHPNGTSVAQTDLFRLAQNSVNVTLMTNDALAGKMVVSAVRVGKWKGNEWTRCDGTQRGWQVSMMIESRDTYMATTVMDLRVAATAVLTLMAHRDESVDEDTGHTSEGQGNLFAQLLISLLLLLLGFIIFMVILWLFHKFGIDAKCRRMCFKIEGACLPRRPGIPHWRQSPFQKLTAASAPKA